MPQHLVVSSSNTIPIDAATVVSYALPPMICYFAMAVLTITPKTRTVRVALWPVIALLAFRAAVSLNLSLSRPKRKFLNIDLVLTMFSITARSLDWALAKEPLVRHLRPASSSPSTIVDAFDLVLNLRGYGWRWSHGLYIPRETRPANRTAFIFCTFLSAIAHAWICGALHRAILTFVPVGTEPIPEASIIDDTLPFLVRYLRASIIATLCAFAVYAVLQMSYDLCTIPAVLFFGQDPAQWPPVFDAPWCATSLSDFWGHRWHQWFRRTFLVLGGYPLSFVLGHAGVVIGAFLASAVFHHIAMITLNGQIEFWWMLVGFGMMGPGVLAERAFQALTVRRVGGVAGWFWTMAWLLLWGNVMTEGFARAGMFGCSSFTDSALPMRVAVEQWVIDFDAWLHSV